MTTKTSASRKTATPEATTAEPPVAPSATPTPAAPTPAPTKQSQLIALLLRDEGATLAAMVAATGWLPHTTRAAMTGLKKKGYSIDSDKHEGVRTYRATAPEAAVPDSATSLNTTTAPEATA